MMYVCSSTLHHSEEGDRIRIDFGEFLSNYFRKETKAEHYKSYVLSKKFRTYEIRQENQNIHRVPRYSIPKIKQLSEILYKRFKLYWEISNKIEIQVNDLQIEAREISRQFAILEQEQTIYFEREKDLLEQIFLSSERNWKWSFDHRYMH